MKIPTDTLVSDCHEALVYTEGIEYFCTRCKQRCKSTRTFGEAVGRRNAVTRERARLEHEVISAAKTKRNADKTFEVTPSIETWNAGVAANSQFIEAVDALTE